jgi:hypothetical protein
VLQNFLGEAPTTTMRRSALGWLDPAVAALILDGPHFALH